MKSKVYSLAVLALVSFILPIAAKAQSDSASMREYQIKAAFLYNFIKFVDWPKEKVTDSNDTIIIGIICEDPFGNAFDPIGDKEVKGRKVVIKRFKSFEELEKHNKNNKSERNEGIETLRKCHLLFIGSSEKKDSEKIIEALEGSSVLTVGETAGFLEAGGIINFLVEDKKVSFEVNLTAAQKAGLNIRSKLLRLAKKVVGKKVSSENKNHAHQGRKKQGDKK